MKAGYPENYFCRDFVEGVPATMGMSGSCSLWHSQFTNMWLMYVGLNGGESVAFKNFVHETDSLHGTFTIPGDDRQLLLLFQYYSETNNDTMYQCLLELLDVDNAITIGNDINDSMQRFALLPHHMMSLVLLLSQSQSVSKTLKLLNTAIPVDSFSILGNYFESTKSNINCLYLKNNYLQPSSARTISDIIKKNCLETLKVTDNHLRHGSIGELSVALSMNYSIHYLTLSHASLKSDDICMLMNALTGKDIQFLDISDNYCGSEGAKSLAMFVRTNKMLRSLDVSKIQWHCLTKEFNAVTMQLYFKTAELFLKTFLMIVKELLHFLML